MRNLLPSEVTPQTVNEAKMYPLGKLPVTFKLGTRTHKEDLHIYSEVDRTLLSWSASKQLGILPAGYPTPSDPETHMNPLQDVDGATNDLRDEFKTAFNGQIKVMDDEQFHISLLEEAKPFCVRTPRSIHFANWHKLQAELQLLLDQNIIAPVTEPTAWCASIVVPPKIGTEKIRLCVDLSHLNKYVRRERYNVPITQTRIGSGRQRIRQSSHFHQARCFEGIPTMSIRCGEPASHNIYHNIWLLQIPMGPTWDLTITEHYNRRMDEAFTGLTGFRHIDDVVIYDKGPSTHADHVRQFLKHCAHKRITANADKWRYTQTSITFAGFKLDAAGYQVDKSITEAISQFPKPTC